uniref:Uncharacterized protein n=1 Tax=Haptolina ericina TaxID=156174 RepID=A0A7S3BVR8_9EUKA
MQFGGRYVAYVGEWGTGMTGTKTFHAALLKGFTLRRRLELPNWARMRAELFLFERRPVMARGPSEIAATPGGRPACQHVAPVSCDACGRADHRLWRCPRSRQYRVCSDQCYLLSEEEHLATLALCFCGVGASRRPPLNEWESAEWLEAPTAARHVGEASQKQWLALAAATPQPEA